MRRVMLISVLMAGCGPLPVEAPPGSVLIAVEFRDAVLGYPLVGLEVCVADQPDFPCARTGQDGKVRAPVPANTEVMLQCAAPLHITTYMTLLTPDADFDVGVFRLLEQSTADLFVATAGAPRDPTRGVLLVNVYDDFVKRTERVAGGTAALESAAGIGPVYGANGALPSSKLSAMSSGGPAGFYDLSPGDYTVTLSHPERSCTRGFGWPTAAETTIRTRVFAQGMSTVTWVCPP
jgi:hypothetical protein